MRVFCWCFVFWKYCCETLTEWVFFFETQNFSPQHCFIKSCVHAAISASTCFQSAALWVSHFNRAASAAAEPLGCELSINKRVCVWPICTSQRSSFSSARETINLSDSAEISNIELDVCVALRYISTCHRMGCSESKVSASNCRNVSETISLASCDALEPGGDCIDLRNSYHASIRISSKPDVNISLSFLWRTF